MSDSKRIDLPKLAAPAQRALASAGITNLKLLSKFTETEIAQLHGMGPNALGGLRAALEAQGLSFKQGQARVKPKKKGSPVSRTDKVDAFLRELRHPLTAEVEAVRSIIKGVGKDIAEEVKWKAPSFNYNGEYLVTFNLWETKRIHLVFHHPLIPQVKSKILEGDYKDRRMAYFADLRDVKAKRPLLEKVLKDLIRLIRSKSRR